MHLTRSLFSKPHAAAMATLILMMAALLALAGCARQQPVAPPHFDPSYPAWNFVLGRYVGESGVDYAAVANDRPALEKALADLQGVTRAQFQGWPEPERLAFLINAHNAFAMQRIVANWPVPSMEATSWLISGRKVPDIKLLGRRWSLNSLAAEILSDHYLESRALFLLNWGQRGCAPLPPVPVTGLNLADLLERQPRRVLEDPAYVQYEVRDHLIRVTPLIDQYHDELERDFTTPWGFLQRYLPADQARQLKARPPRIRYLDFDERLNARRQAQPRDAEAAQPAKATPPLPPPPADDAAAK